MDRRNVKIREGSWLAWIAARKLASERVAIVIGHTIHLHNTTREYFLSQPSWVRHELKHVEQYERLGFWGFLWRYLIESYKNGYWQNALEIEARAAETDDELINKYEIVG